MDTLGRRGPRNELRSWRSQCGSDWLLRTGWQLAVINLKETFMRTMTTLQKRQSIYFALRRAAVRDVDLFCSDK